RRTHFYVVRASCFRAFVAVIRRSTGRSRVDSAQSAAYRAAVTHGGFDCDVLVIGAGPAGAAAAQLLAAWGRSVVLVHRPSLSGCSLAESLPSSTRKLLHVIGQLERVDAAHLYPNTGNVVCWASASRVTTTAEAGFHFG